MRLNGAGMCAIIIMQMPTEPRAPLTGRELISLAQKIARDAEHHAILSASLASQADRLMHAGLQSLDPPPSSPSSTPARPLS
jgi:hypothetical protein